MNVEEVTAGAVVILVVVIVVVDVVVVIVEGQNLVVQTLGPGNADLIYLCLLTSSLSLSELAPIRSSIWNETIG